MIIVQVKGLVDCSRRNFYTSPPFENCPKKRAECTLKFIIFVARRLQLNRIEYGENMISLNFQSMHIVFFRESSKIKRTECTLKFIHYRRCTNQLGIPFADRLLYRRLPRELSKKWAGRDTSKNSLVRKLTNYCRSFRCPSTYKQNRMRMVEGVRVPVARLAIERPIGKREFEKTRKDAETNDETRIDKFSRCRYSTASTTFLGET